jgi:hypothetical protein
VRRLATAFSLALALSAIGASEAAAVVRGEVSFLRGGEPVSVRRSAPAIPGLVRSLLGGPTKRERAAGIRSAIPSGTPLRDVRIERRVVTVDLGARFAAGRDEDALGARIGQLVRTVRSIPGVTGVRVRIEGGVPVGIFPGYDLRRTVVASVDGGRHPNVRETQVLLADLGFLGPSRITGRVDGDTSVAILAFEKWVGLPRDGIFDDAVRSALRRATRPQPILRRPGKRVEIDLGRQVALLIADDRVERVFHISSGAGGATPAGSFRVYRKERMSWSVPFSTWMPWASYFVGGIAFHAYGSVPAYPASHGCIRMMAGDAPVMYAFATHGTPVDVLWRRV